MSGSEQAWLQTRATGSQILLAPPAPALATSRFGRPSTGECSGTGRTRAWRSPAHVTNKDPLLLKWSPRPREVASALSSPSHAVTVPGFAGCWQGGTGAWCPHSFVTVSLISPPQQHHSPHCFFPLQCSTYTISPSVTPCTPLPPRTIDSVWCHPHASKHQGIASHPFMQPTSPLVLTTWRTQPPLQALTWCTCA